MYNIIYMYIHIVVVKSFATLHPSASRYVRYVSIREDKNARTFASLPRVYEADRKNFIGIRQIDERILRRRERRYRNVRAVIVPIKARHVAQLYTYMYIYISIIIKLKIRENSVENLRATCVAPDTLILVHDNNAGQDSPGFGKRSERPRVPPYSPKVVDRSL